MITLSLLSLHRKVCSGGGGYIHGTLRGGNIHMVWSDTSRANKIGGFTRQPNPPLHETDYTVGDSITHPQRRALLQSRAHSLTAKYETRGKKRWNHTSVSTEYYSVEPALLLCEYHALPLPDPNNSEKEVKKRAIPYHAMICHDIPWHDIPSFALTLGDSWRARPDAEKKRGTFLVSFRRRIRRRLHGRRLVVRCRRPRVGKVRAQTAWEAIAFARIWSIKGSCCNIGRGRQFNGIIKALLVFMFPMRFEKWCDWPCFKVVMLIDWTPLDGRGVGRYLDFGPIYISFFDTRRRSYDILTRKPQECI